MSMGVMGLQGCQSRNDRHVWELRWPHIIGQTCMQMTASDVNIKMISQRSFVAADELRGEGREHRLEEERPWEAVDREEAKQKFKRCLFSPQVSGTSAAISGTTMGGAAFTSWGAALWIACELEIIQAAQQHWPLRGAGYAVVPVENVAPARCSCSCYL